MKKEDVMRMARKAGIKNDCDGIWCDADQLMKFAEFVAAAEREECAKECEEQKERSKKARDETKRATDARLYHGAAQTAAWMAYAIRKRGQV